MENFNKEGGIIVLKTRMGGEMDSTNIFPYPIAISIISIGINYVYILGNTIKEIVLYKAGIFKRGSPAATIV